MVDRVIVGWIRVPSPSPPSVPSPPSRTVGCGSRCGGSPPIPPPSAADLPNLPKHAAVAKATCSASADLPGSRTRDAKGLTSANLEPEKPSWRARRSARHNVSPGRNGHPIPPGRTCSALGRDDHIRLVCVFLPIANVRDGQFLHEGRQVAVAFRPQDKMPVIRHQAVRTDTHRAAFERLLDDPFESLEIRIFQKQTHPAHATI